MHLANLSDNIKDLLHIHSRRLSRISDRTGKLGSRQEGTLSWKRERGWEGHVAGHRTADIGKKLWSKDS